MTIGRKGQGAGFWWGDWPDNTGKEQGNESLVLTVNTEKEQRGALVIYCLLEPIRNS